MVFDRAIDFFIIGAPKCGTTAVYNYLCEHPGVFMPQMKEPQYYASDLNVREVRNWEAYKRLFSNAPASTLVGEASTHYLYSEVAVAAIMRDFPDSKLIVMLRNPVDASISMHAHALTYWLEDIGDFEKAWRAQKARKDGYLLGPCAFEPKLLQYGDLFDYPPQLLRLFANAGRHNCLIIIYEEFFADPWKSYAEVQKFLGLAEHFPKSFARVNSHREVNSRILHKFLQPNLLLGSSVEMPLRNIAHRFSIHPRRLLATWNTRSKQRNHIDAKVRSELLEHFVGAVIETEALLGKKLDVWRC